jgi:hypothetical protein
VHFNQCLQFISLLVKVLIFDFLGHLFSFIVNLFEFPNLYLFSTYLSLFISRNHLILLIINCIFIPNISSHLTFLLFLENTKNKIHIIYLSDKYTFLLSNSISILLISLLGLIQNYYYCYH